MKNKKILFKIIILFILFYLMWINSYVNAVWELVEITNSDGVSVYGPSPSTIEDGVAINKNIMSVIGTPKINTRVTIDNEKIYNFSTDQEWYKFRGSITLSDGTIYNPDGGEAYIETKAFRPEDIHASEDPEKIVVGEDESDSGESLVNGGDKVLITTNPNMENATNLTDMSITSNLDKYKNNGVEGADVLRDKSNFIVGILQAVGTVVAVIMLTIIAIKYMISSIEERAEYKQTMVPYIIGAASILIISNLVGLIYSIITNLNI